MNDFNNTAISKTDTFLNRQVYLLSVLISFFLFGMAPPGEAQVIQKDPVRILCDLEVALTSLNHSCDGATACIQISGGTPPYTIAFGGGDGPGIETLDVCFTNLAPGDYSVTVSDSQNCVKSLDFSVPVIDFFLEADIANVSCSGGNDGAIDLHVTNDISITPNGSILAFHWEGPDGFVANTEDIEDLAAGTYCVSVTSPTGNCFGTACFEVEQPSELNLNILLAYPVCGGQPSGCAFVSGGTAPYFIWIFVALPPQVSASQRGILTSFDGLDPAAGFPYDPATSDTALCASNLADGIYFVLVVDYNLCYVWKKVVVKAKPAVSISLSGTDVSCFGGDDGSICFEASGGTPPYSTSLAPSTTPPQIIVGKTGCFEHLKAGTYTVNTTDGNGCTVSETIVIHQPPELEADFQITSGVCDSQVNGCLKVNGGTRPYKVFVWRFPQPLPTDPAVDFPANGDPTIDGQVATDDIPFGVEPLPSDPFVRCAEDIPPGWYLVLVVDQNHCYVLLWVHIEPANPLEANFEITSGVCEPQVNGCLKVNGGTQPYKVFVWQFPGILPVEPVVDFPTDRDPTVNDQLPTNDIPFADEPLPSDSYVRCAEDIPPGWYLVLVVDQNHCYVLLWVHIEPANPLEANFEITSGVCEPQVDGCLKVNGGTQPYKVFVWQFPGILPVEPVVDFPTDSDPTVNDQLPTNDIPFADEPLPSDSYVRCAEDIPPGWYLVLVVDQNHCYVLLWVHIEPVNPLEVNFEITSSQCDDQVDGCLFIEGGTEPYKVFVWRFPQPLPTDPIVDFPIDGDPTVDGQAATNDIPFEVASNIANPLCAENIPPGWYLVLVVDANHCYVLLWIHIPVPNPLKVNGEVTDVSCFGLGDGKIELTISGGTPPYTIVFGSEGNSNSSEVNSLTVVFDNLSAGEYTILVFDANQCSLTRTFVVGQPDDLLVNLSFDPQGTFACSEPSGGTPPYSFVWFDLNSNQVISDEECVYELEPGAYFVIVKDAHGCEANELFVIAPSPCEGGEAVVDPAIIDSGESSTFFLFNWAGSGLQWQFKTIFTGWIDIPGATTEVYETPPIHTTVNKAILIRAAVFCENGTVEFSNTAVLTIIGGGNSLQSPDAEKADARLFEPEQEVQAFQKDRTGKFDRGLETMVYPTVSSGEVNVRFDFQTTTRTHVTVSNLFGRIFLQKELDGVRSGDQLNLHLSSLPSGNYLISVENEGRIDTKRIFIGK